MPQAVAVVDEARPSTVGAQVTSPADSGFPVYGLTTNPFLLGELDPIARPQDLKCVSFVDGWGDLSAAEELIGRQAAVKGPVYFVVEGASQTGRSSVANYLVHLWATENGVGQGPNREVLVHRRNLGANKGSYAPEEQILDWISRLQVRALNDDLILSPTVEKRIDSLSPALDVTTSTKFALALRAVEADLRDQKGKEYLLAAIFERGKGRGLVQMVQDSFETTRAVVVITVDASEDAQDVLDGIDKVLIAETGLLLRLGPIRGTDVGTIIADRWRHYKPGTPCPFDANGVAEAFDHPRPIARTVKLLSKILELQQMYFPDDDPWPATLRLALGAQEMRRLLKIIDGDMDLGGYA
jgi:hypothetical protein